MGRILLVAILMFAAGVSRAEDSSSYSYDYLGSPIPIVLDHGRVAVWAPNATQFAILEAARAAGVEKPTIDALVVDGWHHLGVGELSDGRIRALVATLAEDERFGFVSPVFGYRGLAMLVTPWILAGQHDGLSNIDFDGALEGLEVTIERHDLGGIQRVHRIRHLSRNGFEVLSFANTLARHESIEHAAPDWLSQIKMHLIPNDTFFTDLWGIRNVGQSFGWVFDQDIDGDLAWDVTTGIASVRIAVLDSGVQSAHPDMNSLSGADFTSESTAGEPGNECDNHGTAVAGCISAKINNSTGVVGVAPDCPVRSARMGIAEVPCSGFSLSQDSWLVSALGWTQANAEVTNSSFSRVPSSSVTTAYSQARNAGVIHFASTGNDSDPSIAYPSSLSTVNAVGALDTDGTRASFSNFGTGIAFSAPGVEIATTDRTGSAGYTGGSYDFSFSGTSAASPYAAGVAALGLSVNPTLTPSQLEDFMQQACVDRGAPGYDTEYGWGFVNAKNLVDLIDPPGPSGPPDLVSVSPATGSVAGGTPVILSGSNFTASMTILFGINPLQNVVFVDDTTIQGTTPAASSAGSVPIFVSHSGGTDTLPSGFLYSSNNLSLLSDTAPPGGTAQITALATNDQTLSGFSIASSFDGTFIDVGSITVAGTVAAGADFVAPGTNNVENWWTVGVVLDLSPPLTFTLPPGSNQPILFIEFSVASFAPTGQFIPIDLVSGVGNPPVDNIFALSGGLSSVPSLNGGVIQTVAGGVFIRGDGNRDGLLNIADAIHALDYLFALGPATCLDAVDANDDGMLDIADPIRMLSTLFAGAGPLDAPFATCGGDPTSDGLGCGVNPSGCP
ncbi:MAG: S8 family serine peptidase [Planctomycetes bacterium]|nr:S8 family serine peptidase [Planctomycetota bacterium]